MQEDQRILDMITSADKEMVQLGVILALEKGHDWCKFHIPGPAGRANPMYTKARFDKNQAFVKNRNVITIDKWGSIQWLYLYQMFVRDRIVNYKIVNL